MSERPQTSAIRKLHQEYKGLKAKLFGKHKFLKVEDTPDQRRYDQLFQYFHPQFRTRNFVDPLEQEKSTVE